jgi:hypothetical protein
MAKMLDMTRSSGACGDRCQHAAHPVSDVPDSAGFRGEMRVATSDAGLDSSEALLVKMNEVGLLKTLGCYRELVDVEIARASEFGARWWSRRLVELYGDAGLVRLDK